MEDERPVAWTAAPHWAPVFDADGTSIGTAVSVLGNTDHDIFHGVVVKRKSDGQIVELPADDVDQITTERIRVALTASQVNALPAYEGELPGGEGLLRKVAEKLDSS